MIIHSYNVIEHPCTNCSKNQKCHSHPINQLTQPLLRIIIHKHKILYHSRPIPHALNLVFGTGINHIKNIAQRRLRVRYSVPNIPNIVQALSSILRIINRRKHSSSNITIEHRPVKNPIRCLRLIGRDLVTGLIDTSEREVPILTNQTTDERFISLEISVACSAEFVLVPVWNVQTDGFAAVPVTGVVSVAVQHCDFDPGVEESADISEVAGAAATGCIAGCLEGGVNAADSEGIVQWDTQGGLDPVLVEVADVVVGWERVWEEVGYVVVGASIVAVEGGFNDIAADVICLDAGFVYGCVVAVHVRITCGRETAASFNFVFASAWVFECVDLLVVD